ncbi:hypothetical protein MRX96_059158 [Rhipicephalus microplus]
MDKAENLRRLKRTRRRYESISEYPPKNPKRGSDGRVLFTGGGIQEMMQATLSEITSTVATVKDTLARFVLLYDIEMAVIHPGSFSMHHVDRDFLKRANAEGIRDRAREMGIEPEQFLYERECLITWLLRAHRCILRMCVDLTEVAQSPGEFCRGYRLYKDHKILELGVSGKTLLRGRHLFLFLGHVTQLTELSIFGLYLTHPGRRLPPRHASRKQRKIRIYVTKNVDIEYLFIASESYTQFIFRNMEGLIDAVKGLPLLKCFSISVLDPESRFERSQQLSQLLTGPGCRSLQQAHFDSACDLGPILEQLE